MPQTLQLDLNPRTHIAIMKKSWGLTQKIKSGRKTIESRWYKNKSRPWDQISADDTVYFKDSGEPVSVKAQVDKVLQFSDLTPSKVRKILKLYGQDDGLGIEDLDQYFEMFKDKKYCILLFLKGVKSVKPFKINKSGWGNMAAWLIVDDINSIRV